MSRRVAEGSPREPADRSYIESSALVAGLLERDVAVRRAIEGATSRVASAITFAEARRAVTRARVARRIDAAMEDAVLTQIEAQEARCEVVSVSGEILARAGRAFPVEPVRTLDAIHLATIQALGLPPRSVLVVTRDDRVATNARALGYQVQP